MAEITFHFSFLTKPKSWCELEHHQNIFDGATQKIHIVTQVAFLAAVQHILVFLIEIE